MESCMPFCSWCHTLLRILNWLHEPSHKTLIIFSFVPSLRTKKNRTHKKTLNISFLNWSNDFISLHEWGQQRGAISTGPDAHIENSDKTFSVRIGKVTSWGAYSLTERSFPGFLLPTKCEAEEIVKSNWTICACLSGSVKLGSYFISHRNPFISWKVAQLQW